ncbi:MAG: preprotein translocase subunit SecE [Kiritimatiellae bacterium]|nr:preprotein translocase subunit SecE [Kiritimatiellia bacterium]
MSDNSAAEVQERKGFGEIVEAVKGFFSEVSAEFGRITWPRGKELIESTVVVLFFIVILSVVVLFFDKIIEWALRLVMGA